MLVGLDDYEVVEAEEIDGELVVTVRLPRPDAPCPGCGGKGLGSPPQHAWKLATRPVPVPNQGPGQVRL